MAMLVRVYVAALYLQQKASDADEVIESRRQSKRLPMVFKTQPANPI